MSLWTKIDGFQDVVACGWDSVPARHSPFHTLARKFRATTRELQSWSQRNVGHVKTQLSLAREVLHQLEIARDCRNLSEGRLGYATTFKALPRFVLSLENHCQK